ncbi:MAG: helix-turn-helix domain-containing protein [Deltaproteobacteria bacterium]|nr:helix-turn-helix domain-containing protein [Deltaproteobacteria bacterium]
MSELFNGIMNGIEEATELVLGNKTKGRVTRAEFVPVRTMTAAQIKAIRTRFALSQIELAALMDVSVDAVRKWEQGKNKPEGPSRRFLQGLDLRGEDFLHTFYRND